MAQAFQEPSSSSACTLAVNSSESGSAINSDECLHSSNHSVSSSTSAAARTTNHTNQAVRRSTPFSVNDTTHSVRVSSQSQTNTAKSKISTNAHVESAVHATTLPKSSANATAVSPTSGIYRVALDTMLQSLVHPATSTSRGINKGLGTGSGTMSLCDRSPHNTSASSDSAVWGSSASSPAAAKSQFASSSDLPPQRRYSDASALSPPEIRKARLIGALEISSSFSAPASSSQHKRSSRGAKKLKSKPSLSSEIIAIGGALASPAFVQPPSETSTSSETSTTLGDHQIAYNNHGYVIDNRTSSSVSSSRISPQIRIECDHIDDDPQTSNHSHTTRGDNRTLESKQQNMSTTIDSKEVDIETSQNTKLDINDKQNDNIITSSTTTSPSSSHRKNAVKRHPSFTSSDATSLHAPSCLRGSHSLQDLTHGLSDAVQFVHRFNQALGSSGYRQRSNTVAVAVESKMAATSASGFGSAHAQYLGLPSEHMLTSGSTVGGGKVDMVDTVGGDSASALSSSVDQVVTDTQISSKGK